MPFPIAAVVVLAGGTSLITGPIALIILPIILIGSAVVIGVAAIVTSTKEKPNKD
jgi:uncharacterized membrane protein